MAKLILAVVATAMTAWLFLSAADAFSNPRGAIVGSADRRKTMRSTTTTTIARNMMIDPGTATDAVATTTATIAAFELSPDFDAGELAKTVIGSAALFGGLIPGLISANSAMFKTLSGRKNFEESAEDGAETLENYDPKNTFDPTMGDPSNQKYREYVMDSGATGPEIPSSQFLFSADPIPLADVAAVWGRIKDLDSVADWRDLPSTKRGDPIPGKDPPMWYPRKAFKVQIRKNRFLGWPLDANTGEPLGGAALKAAEEKRVSRKDALIGDAALDAVFDSWSLGASIVTPDKVQGALDKVKPDTSKNEIDLQKFVGTAIKGKSTIVASVVLFVLLQVMTFGFLFAFPLVDYLTGSSILPN